MKTQDEIELLLKILKVTARYLGEYPNTLDLIQCHTSIAIVEYILDKEPTLPKARESLIKSVELYKKEALTHTS